MPTEVKRILKRLNMDDSYYVLPKEDFVDALNITTDARRSGQDNAITNIIGNRLITYNLPTGTNKVIGAKADVVNNRVFEFVYNSNGYHSILIYNNAIRLRTKLIENLTDTNQIDVLQFEENKKIVHVDIIYRGDDEGDLLFWTDGNVSPRKINVKHILDGDYTYIKTPFIELAKRPPVTPIVASYGSDTTRNANSLRKKLVQATYWFVYDDFEKSTPTTYSKVPLPVGYYGSDNDVDSTKNNFITFTVETGDENVTEIQIAVRFNVGNTWDDFVLIVSINKEELSIPDNSTYNYLFYNDSIYPPIDVDEVTQLFDWCPRKAKSQCTPNGNVVALAAITENYDNYPIASLDVTITAENRTNIPPDTDPPQLTFTGGPNSFTFTVSGSVPTGTHYEIIAYIGDLFTVIVLADYTSIPGDTILDVAQALYNSISPSYATTLTAPSFSVLLPTGSSILACHADAGSGGGSDISSEKTWLWDSNYIFGLAYKDDQGRIMPGVTTFINPVDSDNDFMVSTPAFSLDTTNCQTPVISAAINHLPPAGAVSYAWVRRRMTFQDFLFYETCDFQEDADYFYFCLANIEQYKTDNSQFIYGTAPITSESRIKIIAGISGSAYNGTLWTQDYEILGQVSRTLTSGAAPTDDKFFIKVKKTTASVSPAYTSNMLVMVYTPMANPTNIADSVYFEWGEEYDIYSLYTITYGSRTGAFIDGEVVTGGTSGATGTIVNDDGVNQMTVVDVIRTFATGELITGGTSGATATIVSVGVAQYHKGREQDQDGSQPATFEWVEGDVYFHQRTMYNIIRSGITSTTDTVDIMDANFSDFFQSAINDNGRGLTIETNAKETYFPATIRFSREYQQNTSINKTNRFFYNNFLDLDRSFEDIFKMSVKDRYIRIGQRFKIGVVPVFNQISKDSANNTLLAATDRLLNPVQYYVGEYGVGREFPVWVEFNNSAYFFDVNRGIWCRLSLDGVTPISNLYKINSWASPNGIIRTGNYFIYGAFDSRANNCIFSFEAAPIYGSMVVSFSFKFTDGVFLNRYVFSLNNTPVAGDQVSVTLTDGDGVTKTYSYTAVTGDTLTTIVTALRALINADIYFTANIQSSIPSVGLTIGQVTSHNQNLFEGSVAIVYGAASYSPAQTLAFNEDQNYFESFLSYTPEMMVTLGDLLITYYLGQCWTHDSSVYNNFYGVQYKSSLTTVFNDNAMVKKKYLSVGYRSTKIWTSPDKGDVKTSTINPQTQLQQESKLLESNYEIQETLTTAALNYDMNSRNDERIGLWEGDYLGGDYCIVKFTLPADSASELVNFNMPQVNSIVSQRNF